MYNSLENFAFLSHKPEDWKNRLKQFLSVMYVQDLDMQNVGYCYIVKSGSRYENARPQCRGTHKIPEEIEAKGDEAKSYLDKDPVIFKTVQSKPVTALVKEIFNLDFYRHDYYISKNRYQSPHSREGNNLFGYSNIVIDIDDHNRLHKNEARERLRKTNELIFALLDYVFAPFELPMPNGVVYTGRGIQLWWKVAPITVRNHKIFYQTTASYYAGQIKNFIDNNIERFGQFSVDLSASSSESGLVRLPGSYNTKAGTYGDFFLLHDDSLDIYEETNKIWKIEKQERQNRVIVNFDDPLLFAEKREEKLIKLLQYRHANNPSMPELRDLFLFFDFNAFLTATGDSKTAFDHALSFNHKFFRPMPEATIRSYMSTSARKGGYNCSNRKMIECLQISEEEQVAIGLKAIHSQKQREEDRKKREERDFHILQCCRDGVFSETKIAEKVGCSVPTVMRVLKQNKMVTKKKYIHNRFLAACKACKPLKHLQKKYGQYISRSGIEYIIQKAARWRAALEEKRRRIAEKKSRDSQALKKFVEENIQMPYFPVPSTVTMSFDYKMESTGPAG